MTYRLINLSELHWCCTQPGAVYYSLGPYYITVQLHYIETVFADEKSTILQSIHNIRQTVKWNVGIYQKQSRNLHFGFQSTNPLKVRYCFVISPFLIYLEIRTHTETISTCMNSSGLNVIPEGNAKLVFTNHTNSHEWEWQSTCSLQNIWTWRAS